ncbi:hypothetical protein JCM10908_003678 [Rhodotorula pacifica]|uniref:uncharacterized protein n=1 Tax=Rhodotorula pacifica TaxID=1495444 RepID=UPI00317F31C7
MSSSTPLFGGSDRDWPAFEPVNDTIRGGASSSSWKVDPTTNIGNFSGNLDITALGGAGFASQSATFEPPLRLGKRSRTAGLFITFLASSPSLARSPSVRPKSQPRQPHKLVLALKEEKPLRRPDGRRESVTVYQYTIDLDDYSEELTLTFGEDEEKRGFGDEMEKEGKARTAVTVLAKWDQFRPTYRGRPKEDADPLDPGQIYELSFMCRSNFGEQAGPFSFDVVSLAIAPRCASSSGGFRRWFRNIVEAVRNSLARVWRSLAAFITSGRGGRGGDGAVRLP